MTPIDPISWIIYACIMGFATVGIYTIRSFTKLPRRIQYKQDLMNAKHCTGRKHTVMVTDAELKEVAYFTENEYYLKRMN